MKIQPPKLKTVTKFIRMTPEMEKDILKIARKNKVNFSFACRELIYLGLQYDKYHDLGRD